MDVCFPSGELEETIYMRQHDKFEEKRKKDHICLLKRSLYGLKNSSRQWYKRFNQFMLKLKFQRSEFDAYVYFKEQTKGVMVYLLLYVDDMLLACKSLIELQPKEMLKGEFERKDLESAKKNIRYRNLQR